MNGIVWWILYILFGAAILLTPVICAMKGRWGFLLLGLFPFPILPWFVGAGLPATPSSYWARH